MTSTVPNSLRDEIIGAWELIEYCAYKESNPSDKVYPMGPEAKGIIMYTPDGYMSAQLLTPGQNSQGAPRENWDESYWAGIGHNYVGYTGQFYLDEKGDGQGRPILMHHMRTASLPYLVGDTQRRIVRITQEEDGRYLNLGLEAPSVVMGETRVTSVRWRRFPDNQAATPPKS